MVCLYGRPNKMELTHQEDDRWREYAQHCGEDGAEVHPGDPRARRVALHGLLGILILEGNSKQD